MLITQEKIFQSIDELIEKAGFSLLSGDFKSSMREKMFQEIAERLGRAVLSELSDTQLNEYVEILKQSKNPLGDPEVEKFLSNSLPNFSHTFSKILQDYSEEFLREAK